MSDKITKSTTLAGVAAIVSKTLRQHGIDAFLSGGAGGVHLHQ